MDRERFLDHIAARLGRPRRHAPAAPDPSRRGPGDSPSDVAERVERFAAELTRVGGVVVRSTGTTALSAALRRTLDELSAVRIVTWERAAFAGFDLDWLWDEAGALAVGDPTFDDETSSKRLLLAADLGVTTVDAAVAETGSLVVSAAPGRPRAMSLLPRVHLAIVPARSIVPSMDHALACYGAAESLPSAIHFITGPSRTSDIENDLTIGVHGPAAVFALVLEDTAS
jgi:L-lactate dehydrogenase complex protein LldG